MMSNDTTAFRLLSTMNSTNSTIGRDITDAIWLRVIFVTLYVLIFLVGVSGNVLVIYVVARNRAMQTITNIFITNLAASDIMMCLLAIPFTPVSGFVKAWIFGEVLCHIVPMALGISVYVSTLTSMAIAIDRYFVIIYPFKPRMKTVVCLLLIAAIWVVSTSISLPLFIYQRVTWNNETNVSECNELWPSDTAHQFFTVTSFNLQYIEPCSVITFCYIRVSLALRARSRSKVRASTSVNRDRNEMEIQRKRRTNAMLVAMVAIFVCCWLPLNAVLLTGAYLKNIEHGDYYLLVFFIAHVIAMSSTMYNPFLYAYMNDNFQKEFRTVVPFLFIFKGGRRGNASASYASVNTTCNTMAGGPATVHGRNALSPLPKGEPNGEGAVNVPLNPLLVANRDVDEIGDPAAD